MITFILFIAIFIIVDLLGGIIYADLYTVNQHNKRVSQRLDKHYVNNGKFQSYEIYNLYDEYEKVIGFLIEFNTGDFEYILINKKMRLMGQPFSPSMYVIASLNYDKTIGWSNYLVCDSLEQYPEGKWIKDSNYESNHVLWRANNDGEQVYYKNNPFKVANFEMEKKYLLKSNDGRYFPAIKQNSFYINLINYESVKSGNEITEQNSPYGGIIFFVGNNLRC